MGAGRRGLMIAGVQKEGGRGGEGAGGARWAGSWGSGGRAGRGGSVGGRAGAGGRWRACVQSGSLGGRGAADSVAGEERDAGWRSASLLCACAGRELLNRSADTSKRRESPAPTIITPSALRCMQSSP